MADSTNPSLGGHVIQWYYLWVIPKIIGGSRVIAPFIVNTRYILFHRKGEFDSIEPIGYTWYEANRSCTDAGLSLPNIVSQNDPEEIIIFLKEQPLHVPHIFIGIYKLVRTAFPIATVFLQTPKSLGN